MIAPPPVDVLVVAETGDSFLQALNAKSEIAAMKSIFFIWLILMCFERVIGLKLAVRMPIYKAFPATVAYFFLPVASLEKLLQILSLLVADSCSSITRELYRDALPIPSTAGQ